jgi:hypothetical protein
MILMQSPQQPVSARCSLGLATVTQNALNIHLAGKDRSYARQAISSVTLELGLWYGFGFTRKLRIAIIGERRPIVLANMSKANAKAIKAALGF